MLTPREEERIIHAIAAVMDIPDPEARQVSTIDLYTWAFKAIEHLQDEETQPYAVKQALKRVGVDLDKP